MDDTYSGMIKFQKTDTVILITKTHVKNTLLVTLSTHLLEDCMIHQLKNIIEVLVDETEDRIECVLQYLMRLTRGCVDVMDFV